MTPQHIQDVPGVAIPFELSALPSARRRSEAHALRLALAHEQRKMLSQKDLKPGSVASRNRRSRGKYHDDSCEEKSGAATAGRARQPRRIPDHHVVACNGEIDSGADGACLQDQGTRRRRCGGIVDDE